MARLLDIIFDLILVAVVARVLSSVVRSFFASGRIRFSHSAPGPRQQGQRRPVQGEAVRDPVCGMFVSTELAHRLNWQGKVLHFCSEECLEQYRKRAPD